MKKIILIGSYVILGLNINASAQLLNNLGKAIERKATDYIDKQADQLAATQPTTTATASTTSQNQRLFPNLQPLNYDYVRGTQPVFTDDFSADALGAMPQKWTSNGSGAVSKVTIADGNWFRLYDGNTYKIKELVRIPENYTVEFDVIALAEDKNRFSLDFGFDYQKGIGNHYYLAYQNPVNIQASYWFNKLEMNSKEVDPKKRTEVKANMSYFVNDVMKVKLKAVGDRMSVYINEYKIIDTEMLDPITKKYFYFALNQDDKEAEIYISNFRIDKI